MTRLPLRLRVLLLFAGLTGGSLAVVAAALWSVRDGLPAETLLRVGVLAGFGLLMLNALLWWLFDSNMARPLQRLAFGLRARAHADVPLQLDPQEARFLGDIALAATAISEAYGQKSQDLAAHVGAQTKHLERDRGLLAEVLTEIPLAMILVDAEQRIMLYDGQAAEILRQQGVARLGADLQTYFDRSDLQASWQRLARKGQRIDSILRGRNGRHSYDLHLVPLSDGAVLMTIDAARLDIAPFAPRPLVYGFDLGGPGGALLDRPLKDLTFTVLDTETTGLLPHKDEIVQIGAVHVLAGRIVPGEEIDQLVDPGVPIPAQASAVHRLTDAMVAGKPGITEAGRMLHGFAEGTVIVAHNAPFDMAFLHRHSARMGVVWDQPILDTVLLSAIVFGITEEHSLDALCARLSIEIRPALRHTALGDAVATAECLLRLLPILEARGFDSLDRLIVESGRQGRLLQDLN